MKILIIHTLYKIKGGEAIVVENEAYQLRQKGFNVRILYFSNGGGYFKSALKLLLLPFNFISFYRVNRILNNFKPDIIHLHNWNFGASPSVIIAAKNKNIPIVLSLHNYRLLCPSSTLYYNGALFLESLKSNFPWEGVKKAVYRNSKILTLWLAITIYLHKKVGTWKAVDKYIVLTEFKKNIFINSTLGITENQLVVKPNFASVVNSNKMEEKSNFFLFVGRLSEEKGIKILLSAFSNSNLELIIIGEGPLLYLVQDAAECNYNISYKGLLSNNEVKEYMRTASALIFPSIWFEGMPLTIVESFSVSTPVIASKLGAMESMIQHSVNGFHFNAGSIDELRKWAKYWCELPLEDKNRIREGARLSYESHYTPEKNVNTLVSIYNCVINKI